MNLRQKLVDLIREVEIQEGTFFKGAVRDVLTDLIHIMREKGFDPEERFGSALRVAKEENEEKSYKR